MRTGAVTSSWAGAAAGRGGRACWDNDRAGAGARSWMEMPQELLQAAASRAVWTVSLTGAGRHGPGLVLLQVKVAGTEGGSNWVGLTRTDGTVTGSGCWAGVAQA